MGSPVLHEFRRQASLSLREKIRTARLALTDVSPPQLLAEEATNGDLSAPNMQTMRLISRAAFEVDDYWRIVDILHKRYVHRLSKFETRNWRSSYKALMLLEYLLTHGPQSIAEEFQSDEDGITQMATFQYVDEKGFNWGLSVRNLSERIIMLLEDRSFLKEERDRARKVTVGIKGFGSFCKRPTISERCNTEQRLGSALNDPISDDNTWDHHPFCDRDNNHSQASLLSTSG